MENGNNENNEKDDKNKADRIKGLWLLFSFKGRIGRKPYWIFSLMIFVSGLIFGIFSEPVENLDEISTAQIMFMLWMIWPSMAVQAKRWHDLDKSGLWVLINFIPFVGPIWALYENGFKPGTSGPNRFGPEPVDEDINWFMNKGG